MKSLRLMAGLSQDVYKRQSMYLVPEDIADRQREYRPVVIRGVVKIQPYHQNADTAADTDSGGIA